MLCARWPEGETYVAPQLPQDLGSPVPGTRKTNGAAGPLDTLSPRERDIFDLIVRGYTNTAMAETLQLSVKTIETHRAHINKKLRVHSTGELIRLAALYGLVAKPGGSPPSVGVPAAHGAVNGRSMVNVVPRPLPSLSARIVPS